MPRKFLGIFMFGALLVTNNLIDCDHSPTSSSQPAADENSWTKYTPYYWTHDGHPFQATYCTVYSDTAKIEMKQQLGQLADDSFTQLLQLFEVQDTIDFRYPPGRSKIDIYLNRNHPENIAWAYWGGFIITIRSSEMVDPWLEYALYTVRHELTHVFEFLIEGRESLGTDVWFKEGIAVHLGCMTSSAFKKIETIDELDLWISENQDQPQQGNPIAIHQIEDFPEDADWTQYYRFFELAMRYLLDAQGLGQTYQDVVNLFYDLRQNRSFSSSFVNHFEINLTTFEDEFFDRLRNYLKEK